MISGRGADGRSRDRWLVVGCSGAILAWLFVAPRPASGDEPVRGDWPAYGNDAGGTRYSPLAQIDRENVGELRVAWTYRTGEAGDASRARQKAAFEATPIVVDGTLFLSTPFNRVIALDPENGGERWVYDPGVDRSQAYSEITSRGVSTWLDPSRKSGDACHRRIFVATIDARLIALDAGTGRPCGDFGRSGQIDLSEGVRMGLLSRGEYQVTSPPAVIGSLVVVGSSIGDNRAVELERGVVRAYDARSGALRWRWDPIPWSPADSARASWSGESWQRTGAANAWGVISADPERGLVFVPTGSPSPDFYGGERLGDNVYGTSVVALRAETGDVAWYFQTVRHSLWDYDVPAQPTLVSIDREGKAIAAVAVGTRWDTCSCSIARRVHHCFPSKNVPCP